MAIYFPIVEWALGATIYEVNMRQFTSSGKLTEFSNHLPRLKKMGVSIIWFMPLTPISFKKRQGNLGSYYACSNYKLISEEFGTETDFKDVVKQAHQLGMKVIIDWVANHTGYDHVWSKFNPEWYLTDEKGNFTERNGWVDVIDLDYSNNNLRIAMIETMQYWIKEFDIDGFRCDMAHLVPLDFWYTARENCDTIKRLFWLAECDDDNYFKVFDATYSWKLMHETEQYLQQKMPLSQVINTLTSYSDLSPDTFKLLFTSNHDENSWNGTEYEKYGNAVKPLAVLSCTWKGISLIYSGQEIPNLKRLKFFEKDTIHWGNKLLMENFYTKLFLLRQNSAIAIGETFICTINNPNILAYFRKHQNQVVLVLLNFSNEDKIRFTINNDWLEGIFENLFSKFLFSFNGTEIFELQAYEARVYFKVV
jgi:glycosidase